MKEFINRNKYIIFSFLIPLCFFLLFFISAGIYPLGDNGLFSGDAIQQYISFLQEYKYKILNREGIIFSMESFSNDFYMMWLYYLTSPINIIIFLFKDIYVAFTLIVVIKICLIGVSMSLFLNKTYKKNDINITIFSCAYSMSGWVMTFYCNFMWLDILIIFPWVIYYFKRMMKKEKTYIYPIVLAIIIYINFYMSLSVCIFLCILFFLQEFNNIGDFLRKGVRFAVLSILGGLMAAAFFFPYLSFIGNKSFDVFNIYFLTDFASQITKFFALYSKNTSLNWNIPASLYCGVITLFFFTLYIVDNKIPLFNRIKNSFLVIFIFVSLNISTLNIILHGFYKPNGYHGRYSYILIFFMVCFAYEAFSHLKYISKKRYIIASLITLLIFIASYVYINYKHGYNEELTTGFITTIIILVISVIIKCVDSIRKKEAYLCFILGAELFFSSMYDFKVCDVNELLVRDKYMNELAIKTDNRSFIDDTLFHNQEINYGLNSISIFSSSIDSNFTIFTNKLGFYSGEKVTNGGGHSPITDILFNLEYVYNRSNRKYFYFDKIASYEDHSVYKNEFLTYYGYILPKRILNWEGNDKNVFNNLNEFVEYYFDDYSKGSDIYDIINPKFISIKSGFKEALIETSDNITIEYIKSRESDGNSIIFEHIIGKDRDNLCIKIRAKYSVEYYIYVNDILVDSYNQNVGIITLTNLKEGDNIKIKTILLDEEENGKISADFAYFNKSNFIKFADDIVSNGIVVQYDDRKVYGTVEYREDSVIFISIPYSDGWSLLLNNKEEDIFYSNIYCIMFDLSESGDFILSYMTPHLISGISISIMSMFIWFIYFFIVRKREAVN